MRGRTDHSLHPLPYYQHYKQQKIPSHIHSRITRLVKYWTKTAMEGQRKTITRMRLTYWRSKTKTREGTRSAKGENVMMLYIEHEDGTPIDGNMAAQIRENMQD